MKFLDGSFKGNVSSLDDILPCPRCRSLRNKRAPRPDLVYYETRYQCKDCGQFFRFDNRPTEMPPQELLDRHKFEQKKSNIIVPR